VLGHSFAVLFSGICIQPSSVYTFTGCYIGVPWRAYFGNSFGQRFYVPIISDLITQCFQSVFCLYVVFSVAAHVVRETNMADGSELYMKNGSSYIVSYWQL